MFKIKCYLIISDEFYLVFQPLITKDRHLKAYISALCLRPFQFNVERPWVRALPASLR